VPSSSLPSSRITGAHRPPRRHEAAVAAERARRTIRALVAGATALAIAATVTGCRELTIPQSAAPSQESAASDPAGSQRDDDRASRAERDSATDASTEVAEEMPAESTTATEEHAAAPEPQPEPEAPVADAEVAEAEGSAEPPAAGTGGGGAGLPSVAAGTWMSGAAGTGVPDGSFADWRGRPLDMVSTWNDNNEAMVELWQLHNGGEYGSWTKSIDIAIGAIGDGESWEAAAGGAYDARWRTSLTNMRNLWGSKPGTVFIRFAHEMNGDWYAWSVNAGNHQAFIKAWKRFRALQQEIFPDAQLVFCVNRESIGSGIDWRKTFPGAQFVDVMAVDYYNGWPDANSAAVWRDSLDDVDDFGAPKGLQRHLDFARSVGLPLAIPEWSARASHGDSPAFFQGMNEFLRANGGSGAGEVLYEALFNVDMHGDDYRLYGSSRLPRSAEAYRSLW
jgi:Glycosyl hydrolase family 26